MGLGFEYVSVATKKAVPAETIKGVAILKNENKESENV